jgi:nicotinamide-nucleotide amidase
MRLTGGRDPGSPFGRPALHNAWPAEHTCPRRCALQARGWMMAIAESCTGGMIAAACTDLSGSSNWFERGFVTYSNQAKCQMLGVEAALIECDGAVSETVARAMTPDDAGQPRASIGRRRAAKARPAKPRKPTTPGATPRHASTPTLLRSTPSLFPGCRAPFLRAPGRRAAG